MVLVLSNADVFDGESRLGLSSVVIEDGKISAILPAGAALPEGAEVEDLGGALLAPGFVDVQVNGGGGVMYNSERNIAGLGAMIAGHAKYGTTTIMPTLITDTVEVMRDAASAMQEAIASGLPGIRGVHFEGPCLSPDRKGVHNKEFFQPLTDELVSVYTQGGMGSVIVTLAPEMVELEQIKKLKDAGILVCAGHTNATYDQITPALEAGVLRGFTHLYNAMSPMTSREPAVVGAALDSSETWCGLIPDGFHVHFATVRNAVHAKAKGKIMLVTDAMGTVGAIEKKFTLYGIDIFAKDGRCVTADGTIAGSDLDMMTAVRNAHTQLGLSLEEALRMASLYPAEFLKLDSVIGRIKPGYDADLVAIEPEGLVAKKVWIGGDADAVGEVAA